MIFSHHVFPNVTSLSEYDDRYLKGIKQEGVQRWKDSGMVEDVEITYENYALLSRMRKITLQLFT